MAGDVSVPACLLAVLDKEIFVGVGCVLAKVSGKKLPISSVRVKKFCSTTEFDARKAHSCGFKAPYTLDEGLARTLEFEFVHPRPDDIIFKSE